jgi:uncharacterized protein (UPF0335 family)
LHRIAFCRARFDLWIERPRGLRNGGRLRNVALRSASCEASMSITAASEVVNEAPATRFAKDQLKAIIERVERLEEEKKTIADDIRDVYAEAKGNGFDVKTLRVVVRLRKQDLNDRKEQEAILETYLHALGML